jgi:hypothetical protein
MRILQAAVCAVAIAVVSAQAQQSAATSQTMATKPTNILFLCPHGAAKSVLVRLLSAIGESAWARSARGFRRHGSDLKDVPPGQGKLVTWNDAPGPSENFAGATEAIRKHAEALVDELVRATR